MASPVSKLNRFSRFFSSKSLASFHNVKSSPSYSKLDSSSELAILPNEIEGLVETPSTNRSPPTHCSTPDLGLEKKKVVCKTRSHLVLNPSSDDCLSSPCHGNGWKKSASLRSRCFGISDGVTMSGKKVKRLHQSEDQETKLCNVFSTAVIPSVTCDQKTKINRLSGLLLSPTSVSWTNQSPFPPKEARKSEFSPWSGCFLHQSMEQDGDAFGNGLYLNHIEQCPAEKVYHWEESEDKIIVEENIGNGGFGQVFKGTYRGEKVAIKKIESSYKTRQVLLETFQGEINGLRFRHPNIVRSLVVIQGSPSGQNKFHQSPCYVVMEHAGDRNLSQVINNPAETIDVKRRESYCRDILHGLAYLHHRDLAHLDVKPSNIITTSSDTCKLCDFGSCVPIMPLTENGTTKTSHTVTSSCDSAIGSSLFSSCTSSSSSVKSVSHILGTFIYRAPELLRGYSPNLKADIFSFAITAWQIWSRTTPYQGQHYHTTVYGVVALGLRPLVPSIDMEKSPRPIPDDISGSRFLEVLTCCWKADPCERPSAVQTLDLLCF